MSVPPVAQIPRKSSAPPIIGIVAVALVMFIVVGGVVLYLVMGAAHNYQQQQAIASVYQQRKAAFDAFSARAKQHVFFRKNSDQLMADVRAINITGCPTDFQDKFLANVNALGELTIEVKSDTGAMGVIRFLGEARTLDTKSMADELKGLEQVALAYQMSNLDLDQCARNHGLIITNK